ncbi:MAG TPA: hypothetical protein VKA70_17050 [Blastocatellia bacterium]|nr:hypothetical protein [Blastocatellia bacterium]
MIERPRTDTPNRLLMALALAVMLAPWSGCTSAPTNSNSTTNANTTAANSNTSVTPAAAADWAASVKEPDRYSVTMTISGQGQANQRQATLPPQQIQFARNAADRRWQLNLPAPVGQIVYLEKSGLKYLILPGRNQYVELKPEELGFQLGSVLTPSAMVERLKPRAQYEQVGTEAINGRPAVKYRFVGAADTKTQAGTVQSDSFVYMDQETGLPLRADLNFSSTSGAVATGTIMTENIQMNPDLTLFEVPTGMKKVETAELKQQVQNFISTVQLLVQMMRQQTGTPPPPPPPAGNVNGNANRP